MSDIFKSIGGLVFMQLILSAQSLGTTLKIILGSLYLQVNPFSFVVF